MKRFLTLALAVVLCASMLLPLFPSAETTQLGDKATYDKLKAIGYQSTKYYSPEDKLATMTKVIENTTYALYVQEFTGEVCVVNRVTGQMLFTNPYDVADSKASGSVKDELLSQILIGYYNGEGIFSTMDSYRDGAQQEQILVKAIRGGARVEYTLGAGSKKRVVPHQIEKTRFEETILRPFYEATNESDYTFEQYLEMKHSGDTEKISEAENAESFDFGKFVSFYTLLDPSNPSLTAREQSSILSTYPITEKMPIYTVDEKSTATELNNLEKYIRQYTEYSLEDMLTDHEMVGYELENSSPAIFKMALEYTLEEDGFQVRLPARGISFDAATYKLDTIQILPFLGAGRVSAAENPLREDDGYNFIPDGSGAIIDFKQNSKATKVSGTLYGNDFGFYEGASAATASYQTWRAPVYGTVMESKMEIRKEVLDENGKVMMDENKKPITEVVENRTVKQGYLAIITEGESLTRVDAASGGTTHEYHAVSTTFFARQTDSYPLDGITVSGGQAVYTKSIERKYVGNYTIKYRLLWDDEADYVGMANAFRSYLEKQGVLKKLDDNKEDIRLYLDLLGALTTTDTFLGMPVEKQAELTTFENAKTILAELKEKGISEQVVRYLGWMNGGLTATAPTEIDVEKVLGGEKGLKDLIAYVQGEGNRLYLDLDFAYVYRTAFFDGFDEEDDTAKTIDNKPAFYKTYNPAFQAYNTHVAYIVSPHKIADFYGEISEKYSSFFAEGQKNISVGSLGTAINSSQDELFPLNRENSKEELIAALEKIAASNDSVLVNKGNYYTWKYADTVLDIPLDSSNRNTTTAEVPFLGIVLHGYMNYTGEAINLSGDYEYTILKTIENGGNPYFVLAYQNIPELKINGYGEYYAVRYEDWKEDLVKEYNTLNEVLSPLQNCTITDHEILGNRIVKVTYSNGTQIYLNYNNFAVTYESFELAPMGFVVDKA